MFSSSIYILAIVVQALASRCFAAIMLQPKNILVRPVPKLNVLEDFSFAATKPLRKVVLAEIGEFAVEEQLVDLEAVHAGKRLIPLKRQLTERFDRGIVENRAEIERMVNAIRPTGGRSNTYNYSEAVANICHSIFVNQPSVKKIALTPGMEKGLVSLLCHIQRFPESYYIVTNNHLLNNARALILGGVVLQDGIFLSSGLKHLTDSLVVFDNEDSIFRERSSHYHLLILMWLSDVRLGVRQVDFLHSKSLLNKLDKIIDANLPVASVLASHCPPTIPLIGDVSPDEPPTLTAAHFLSRYPNLHSQHYGWQKQGDWITYQDAVWSLVTCSPTYTCAKYPTHSHDDWGSFCISYKGNPILVDLGRKSYAKDATSQLQTTRKCHNTLQVFRAGKTARMNRFGSVNNVKLREVAIIDNALVLTEYFEFASMRGKWTRSVSLKTATAEILDHVSASQEVEVICNYNFSPAWDENVGSRFQLEADGKPIATNRVARVVTDEFLSESLLNSRQVGLQVDGELALKGTITCVA